LRALVIDGDGGLEGLVVREVPTPKPGPQEVLVRIEAASVDYVDTLIVTGEYQIKVPRPFIPGNNFAGVVEAVGSGCTRFAVGDRVHGITGIGAFAELLAIPETKLRPTPAGLAPDLACLAGVGLRTAYDSLVSTANIQPGEDLVILGAAGAVGSSAILLGKALGARVIACASSDDKLDFCRSLGADEVVRYTDEGLKEKLKEVCNGGADVVLDMVGGEFSEPALRATGYGGRFVVVGFAAGAPARIPLNLVLLKGSIIRGYEIADFEKREAEQAAANRGAMEAMMVAGTLVPRIVSRFALADAAEAMRTVRGRDKHGNTVLTMS
jgi:NADPH:quinone reductase